MVIRTAVVFLLVISTAIAAKIPEKDAKKIHLPAAKCTFSVHKEGPQGEQIIGNTFVICIDNRLFS